MVPGMCHVAPWRLPGRPQKSPRVADRGPGVSGVAVFSASFCSDFFCLGSGAMPRRQPVERSVDANEEPAQSYLDNFLNRVTEETDLPSELKTALKQLRDLDTQVRRPSPRAVIRRARPALPRFPTRTELEPPAPPA